MTISGTHADSSRNAFNSEGIKATDHVTRWPEKENCGAKTKHESGSEKNDHTDRSLEKTAVNKLLDAPTALLR